MEDASVHASQTHISCTIPPKPYTRTVLVAGHAVRLATDSKTAPVNGSSIRPCFSALRAGSPTFLSDDSNDKRLVQIHDRLLWGSQATWRRSRLGSVVDNQRRAVEHKHTYLILPSKRPSPCKRPPPIFDDPMVCVYMRYTYKWLLRVNTHPYFLAREFQAPMGAYSGDYGTWAHTYLARPPCRSINQLCAVILFIYLCCILQVCKCYG